MELPPYIDARTGVRPQEVLQTLAPLASSLEVLNLSGRKLGRSLGGTIAARIMVFSKLKKLDMPDMDLEGKIFMSCSTCIVLLLIVN